MLACALHLPYGRAMNATMTTVVVPFNLPGVHVGHLPGIFCAFDQVVSAHIARLREGEDPLNLVAADFFQHLLETVDHDAFRRTQVEFLSPRWLESGNRTWVLKYVDPIIWFSTKLSVATKLGLHTDLPQRVLDIGTGPGHFPAVARYFGHDVTATERSGVIGATGFYGSFYRALCDIYGVARVPLDVRAFEKLVGLDGRFDLMTAMLVAFDVDEEKEPWSIAAWDHFLDDISQNVLNETGRIHVSVDLGKVPDRVAAHLRDRLSLSTRTSFWA